jgi:hypothetical protein
MTLLINCFIVVHMLAPIAPCSPTGVTLFAKCLHPIGAELPAFPLAPAVSSHVPHLVPDSLDSQQSVSGAWGWQCGDFLQTRAHFSFSQSAGRRHFQSHNGSSQTDSQAGVGFVHYV